jgi:hypothetical protein
MPEGAQPLAVAAGEHTFADSAGKTLSSGDAEIRLFADRLQIAPPGEAPFDLEFLDVDAVRSADYGIELSLWPEGKLVLARLGRLWESFAAALLDARDDAALHGALAHGLAEKARFDGAIADAESPVSAWLRVYPTHLAAMPRGGLPLQVPWGAVEEIRFDEPSYSVVLRAGAVERRFGRLARKTEAFRLACEEARREQQERIALAVKPHLPALSPIASRRLTGAFQDGLGVSRSVLEAVAPGSFDGLIELLASGERRERARKLAAASRPGEARVGIVELLDAEQRTEEGAGKETGTAPPQAETPPLSENLAAFLLAPLAAAPVVALELLCGPAAATYVFQANAADPAGGLAGINVDLQTIHFRRAVLALTEAQALAAAGRPYRLALRAVPAVARLRAATLARIAHRRGDFETALGQAISRACDPASRESAS